MNWVALVIGLIARFPVERFLIKRKEPEKELDLLLERLTKTSPQYDQKIATHYSPPSASKITTKETLDYQKREIGKELLLLEKHLQQSCKINGKACDCCEKHPLAIEGLAQEALGMIPEPIFENLITWARFVAPLTTAEASESGHYDNQYPDFAVRARALRKRLMETEEIKALLTPEQLEKVHAEVKDILSKPKVEGGTDGGETKAPL